MFAIGDRLVAFDFDEEKHPRNPAGSPEGGRFVSPGDPAQPEPLSRLLARGAEVATNGPATRAFTQRAMAYRTQVENAPGGAPLVQSVVDWQNGHSGAIRAAAEAIADGDVDGLERPTQAHDEAQRLMEAVDEAPPVDRELVRGLVLDHVPAVGDSIDDALGSWTENPDVASAVMDIHQRDAAQRTDDYHHDESGAALQDHLDLVLGPREPGTYYRIVHEDDYQRMRSTGVIDSEGAHNLEITERSGGLTGMAVSNDAPEIQYFDSGIPSRVLAFHVDDDERTQASRYDSLITKPIPFDRMTATSGVITKTGADTYAVGHDGPGERVMLVADNLKAVPISALAYPAPDLSSSSTPSFYNRPAQVTAQEFLSGGRYQVTAVEPSAQPHGFAMRANATWRHGNADTLQEDEPYERVPTTIVHVEQVR